ncbi:MAG: rane transport protein [Glaciihabitans sp.]|nr:rane transport protein [Glaciihabitans sp.]MDQ1569764.1 transporter, family, multidrug resistance protein [Actinomycetota bacterium]
MTTVVHPGDSLSGRQRLVYVLVLGALTALGPFTIDIYLPSLPLVQSDFGVSVSAVQITLSATIIGFALGQLIVGPWSDKVGRRLPLIIATAVHVVASISVALSPSIEWLVVGRVLQGFGAAAGGVVAAATVRDLFGGYPLVRMLSRLALVSGLAPVIAPLAGSTLLLIMPWRGIFIVLAVYGLLVVIASFLFIVETLPPERRIEAGHSSARQRYHALFTDRQFVGIAIVGGMIFTGLFGYLASSPFLFQEHYHFDTQQYGLLFAINSVGIIIGVQSSSRLAKYFGPQWIVAIATGVMLTAAIVIVVLDLFNVGLLGVLIPLWFFICSCGFCFPCVQVLALAHHGKEAGTAASLLGAVNFGLAGLISPVVGLFGVSTAIPMGGLMICTSIVAIAALWLVVRPKTVPALAR